MYIYNLLGWYFRRIPGNSVTRCDKILDSSSTRPIFCHSLYNISRYPPYNYYLDRVFQDREYFLRVRHVLTSFLRRGVATRKYWIVFYCGRLWRFLRPAWTTKNIGSLTRKPRPLAAHKSKHERIALWPRVFYCLPHELCLRSREWLWMVEPFELMGWCPWKGYC